MEPQTAKAIATFIVSLMTFLGWNTGEYAHILPLEIREHVLESSQVSSTTETLPTKTVTPKTPSSEQKQSSPTKKQPKKIEPNIPPNTNTAKTPEKQKTSTTTPKVVESTPKTTPKTTEDKIIASTVNLYCTRINGRTIQKTTGSGVVIDPNGTILTNAHVAEYFLLAQSGDNTSCVVRTGSPATNSYKAKLVFLPKVWVENNKNNLSLSTLTGTGEHDYALLKITERLTLKAPDVPLPSLDISQDEFKKGDGLYIAGYPAGFSNVKLLESALYPLIKKSEVTNLASFSGDSVDVINTSPTALAEHGASGGPITDTLGNLRAITVATTIDTYTGGKNIQAVTLPYITSNIKKQSGKTLKSLISNADEEVKQFEKTSISILANILLGR